MKFNIEVARLFPNGTWDSVWQETRAKNEDLAKEKAEQQTMADFASLDGEQELSHVVAICIQEGD